MRICLVSREYGTVNAGGGIGALYGQLGPSLVRQGHELDVLTLSPDGRDRREELEGVRLHLLTSPLPGRLWPLEDLVWPRTMARRMRGLPRPDVVLSPEYGGDAAALARARGGPPVATNLTSSLRQILAIMPHWERGRRLRLKHVFQDRGERRQTQASDALVANSRAILTWARELWDLDGIPAEVVNGSVDAELVSRLAASGEPPDGYPEGGPRVAFSGRLETRKGVHVLIEAMRAVWERHPDARLVVMGADRDWQGGSMAAHLADRAGPHADRLHLLGPQPPERLFPALARADVVALPSLWENFANAGLEAMALGRPLVATRGNGFDDMVDPERTGLLVEPGEQAPLADALERLLGDEALRRRLGEAGAAAVRERFSPDLVARRYAEFLARVAGG